MSTAVSTIPSAPARRAVLADLIPGAIIRDIIVIVAGAGLVGLAEQVSVPLWFTPVPVSLGTLAVFLVGSVLGPWRAAATLALFLVAGVAGAPMFVHHAHGWNIPTFGYALGYLGAAIVIGALAQRGSDRSVWRTVVSGAAGAAIIYAAGVPWLMAFTHVGLGKALAIGVVPFLIGDALKVAAAAGILPTVWRFTGSKR